MSEVTTLPAPTQANAEATQSSEGTESADLDEGLRLLDEIEGKAPETQADETTETAGESTEGTDESEAPDADLDALLKAERETAAEKASRETEERLKSEGEETARAQQAERTARGIQQAFTQRAQAIRQYVEKVNAGEIELDADTLVNTLNAHHAQIGTVTHLAYWDGTDAFAKSVLPKADAEALIAKRRSFDDHTQYLKALEAAIRKDEAGKHVPASESRKQTALALVKNNRAWEKRLADAGVTLQGVTGDRIAPSVARTNGSSSRGRPSGIDGYESKLAKSGLSDTEWNDYMQLRQRAGMG